MDIDIGIRLKEERERLKLSQAALAEIGGKKKLAQLKYEQGDSSPTAAYLAAVERVGIDVLYVVTGVRTSASLVPEELELLTLFRAASQPVKAAVRGALQGALGTSGAKIQIGGKVQGQVVEGGLVNQGPVSFGNKKGKK